MSGPGARLARLVEPDGFAVTEAARQFAVWMVLDSLTVALAGARMESATVRAAGATFARYGAAGPAAAFPIGQRLAAPSAAAVNACAVHSIDFDDSYMAGGVKAHFSASIVPTAFAVGEEEGATGVQVLDAIVRGFEVAARLGHALSPSVVERWHPTGVVGVVGCAAAAASLLGLSGHAAEMALGLGADHAAGTRFCLASGDATKSLHAAFAAHDGIVAARMANDGVAGPTGFLDGLKGFCETYLGAVPSLEFRGLDDGRALIELNCTKFYPVMHALHAAVDVAIGIGIDHPVQGPREIDEIVVTQSTTHARFGAYWDPETELAARLSLPYAVAIAVLERTCGVDQFRRDRLGEQDFRALLHRVRIEGSDELESTYGSRVASSVRVRFADGAIAEGFAVDPLGFPERPATDAQRLDKAGRLALRVMPAGGAELLIDTVRSLPYLEKLTPLTDLLIRTGTK